MLSNAKLRAYSRQIAIPAIGITGQEALENARVTVVGAGGLGCPALTYLAAAGVGHIVLIDPDNVEISNLHRQVLFTPADAGTPKAIAAARRLREQGYSGTIETVVSRITPENATRLLDGADLVLDCTDNFDARYCISDAALKSGIDHIWGAVYRLEGSVATFPPDGTLNYRAQFPEEPPPELSPTCETGGVLGAVCGVVGSMMAASTVVSLTKKSANKTEVCLQTYDAANASVQTHALTPVRAATKAHEKSPTVVAEVGLESFTKDGNLRDSAATLIDVREPHEIAIYGIPNAHSYPLSRIAADDLLTTTSLPTDRTAPVLTICKSGHRSRIAAQLLAAHGYTDVNSISGGAQAYAKRFLPNVTPEY